MGKGDQVLVRKSDGVVMRVVSAQIMGRGKAREYLDTASGEHNHVRPWIVRYQDMTLDYLHPCAINPIK